MRIIESIDNKTIDKKVDGETKRMVTKVIRTTTIHNKITTMITIVAAEETEAAIEVAEEITKEITVEITKEGITREVDTNLTEETETVISNIKRNTLVNLNRIPTNNYNNNLKKILTLKSIN